MQLTLGQRVIATRNTGVCEEGERGIVYELYEPFSGTRNAGDDRMSASIIFERGRYDGFNPKEQDLMIKPLEEHCEFGSRYRFRNVTQLVHDYRAGRFTFKD